MRLIDNSSLNDCNYIERINGLIRLNRDKISLCGDAEKIGQEIEELRRRCCCEESARKAKLDEWSLQQLRDPHTVSQLLTQIRELQDRANSSSNAWDFHDPETASSSGAYHDPSQPLTIPSPRTMPCRDSGLPHDGRNIVGTSGNVFERLPAREGPPSDLFERSQKWASSSHGLRPDIAKTQW